jgi:hypothetical protein
MRNAIVRLPETRSIQEERQVLRAAIRQLERADLYLGAVAVMGIADADAGRAVRRLRADLEGLRQHLVALRAEA